MNKPLLGQKIAVLVASGFSEKDLVLTQKQLMAAGAEMKIVSMNKGLVNSWNGQGWGLNFAADMALNETLAADFTMLLVPGGQRSIDKLKMTAHTKRIFKGFMMAEKPVAMFDEALELMDFSEMGEGYMVSGSEAMKEAMVARGAEWSDEMVSVSNNMITVRSDAENTEEGAIEVIKFFMESVSSSEPETLAA
ncbi:MAG: DJ-1/PfpI family protein [Micavibrio sp.]|nr:DJ-1/PfpI family protein [Micavibrio sp.]|tara:strand:+ start:52 stop:630 length:579 start_codon:yes stop_codon:yes gene_type:complete